MEDTQRHERMREVAERFSDSVAKKDVDTIQSCFSEDCIIEFLNVRLEGKLGVREWIKWLYGHMSELVFENNTTVAEGDILVRECVLVGKLHNGIKMKSRQAQIVTFNGDGLIRSFRFYYDRLDFVESAINRVMATTLRQAFNQKTMKHLMKYVRE